jgi:hypothetical protein
VALLVAEYIVFNFNILPQIQRDVLYKVLELIGPEED